MWQLANVPMKDKIQERKRERILIHEHESTWCGHELTLIWYKNEDLRFKIFEDEKTGLPERNPEFLHK